MTRASQGWRAGDLAVCLNGIGWWGERDHVSIEGPKLNQVVRIAAVYPDLGLEFCEFPNDIWPAREFRRIEPDLSAAADARADFVALMKRMCVRASA